MCTAEVLQIVQEIMSLQEKLSFQHSKKAIAVSKNCPSIALQSYLIIAKAVVTSKNSMKVLCGPLMTTALLETLVNPRILAHSAIFPFDIWHCYVSLNWL